MKKFLCLLMTTFMLFGCAEITESSKADSVKIAESHNEINGVSSFESFDEFFSSDICAKMKEEGFTPRALNYDSEKYELMGIESDSHFYDITLKDIKTNELIIYTVTYDYNHNTSQNVQAEGNVSTVSAEKNGESYDLRIENQNGYSLSYDLNAGYKVTINRTDNNTTQDEILEYFDDFELVETQEE